MTLMVAASDDAAIFEYSYTTGAAGPYVLAGAWGSYKRFSNRFVTGNLVLYRVTDGSANTEYCTGTYDSATNTLTRTVVDSTNGGAPIDWTGRTRLMVHPLDQGLPLCATPPEIGQVLTWDGTEWCPETPSSGIALCATPPMDGQVLVWSAVDNAYCPADFCTLVAACMTPPFSIGAVSFTGTPAGWNFPAMVDSPVGSLSVWLYVSRSQFASPPQPVGGNLFSTNEGYLLNGPGVSQSMYIGGSGMNGSTFSGIHTGGNTITSITATNPAVVTFANPHDMLVDSVITAFSGSVANDSHYYPTPLHNYFHVTAVTTNSITVAYDASAAVGAYTPESNFSMTILNTLAVGFFNAANSASYTNLSTTITPQDEWFNLLMSWDMNHASGSRILQCFFGDTQISFVGSSQEVGGAFSVYYSNPNAGEGVSWYIGSNASGAGPVCYMGELWFAPGQFVDFTVAANRQKFHDATTGKAISLGMDGSLPTGTIPTLYLTEPSTNLGLMPLPSIDASATPGAFVGNNEAYLQLTSPPFANGITGSTSFMLSMWIDQHTVGTVVDANSATITLNGSILDVQLFGTPSGFLEFQVPYSAGDGVNIRVAVDMNHAIGAKVFKAYVGTSPASVTVVSDTHANTSIDWTGYFHLLFYTTGYFGDVWIAPNQFFDPVNDFADMSGNPVNLGTDGSSTSHGVAPSIYFHISNSDVADAFATNRGTAGPFTIEPASIGHLSLISSTPFFNNATGLGALNMRSDAFDFEIAPSSPS